jgi:transcriptional regulator with GAF, ATPase, and Fis domain
MRLNYYWELQNLPPEGISEKTRPLRKGSVAQRVIMKQINLLTSTDASVLITGETGTGKDHIPYIIHSLNARRKHLFVKINCAALSPSFIRSEHLATQKTLL